MFAVITNTYNKKTKVLTLMELFTVTGKLKKCFFFWQLYMFDVCTTGTRHTSIRNSSSCTWPLDFCLHRHPVSVNCLYHTRMVLSLGRSFAYFARNARCTVTTHLFVRYSNTQHDFYSKRPFSHYIHSHRLAAEMWITMKNNLLGKQVVELFLLSLQIS